MKQGNQWILAVLVLIIVGLAAALAYTWWQPNGKNQEKTIESKTEQSESTQPAARTFTSAKGVKIELDNWPENNIIKSPLTITGRVPGNWSSEGVFPIDVVYEGDIGGGSASAKLEGDWMTEAMVPFTATLTFDEKLQASNDVTIILRNANPSGNPENDDSLSLKVKFS